MAGVYGSQLVFFAEQYRTVEYFSMKTDVVAGYSDRTVLGKIRGVFQYLKRGELSRENDTLSDVNIPTFWTKKKLQAGNFIKLSGSDDEDIYRIVNPSDWRHEGDFCIYVLETVSGNTDEQEPHEYVDFGQDGGFW